MTIRKRIRTTVSGLMCVAILVALAASGSTSTTSSSSGSAPAGNSGNGPAQSNPASPSGPQYTPSQQNAITAARNYLDTEAFSKIGLIQQLSSSAGDGYPYADAVFAVDHIKVDWYQEAVQAAKNYLQMQSFSCQGLVQQLSSSAGDQYTPGQAEYAGRKVGLC